MMRALWLEYDAFQIEGLAGEDLVWRGWRHQQSARQSVNWHWLTREQQRAVLGLRGAIWFTWVCDFCGARLLSPRPDFFGCAACNLAIIVPRTRLDVLGFGQAGLDNV